MSFPKILVVEDNPISRKLVRIALKQEGYEVLEAPDGASALSQVARDPPDLILQDLGLPDMDGFSLVSRFRALPELESVPILAFSGFLTRLEFGRAAAAGFTDFLAKPVEPSRLVETIRQHLPLQTRAPARKNRGLRILLVDDDPVQLKLGKLGLGSLGFSVTTAADGRAALEAARNEPPDGILSDVLMPRMDGFELTMEVRRDPSLARIPVVLVSSNYVEKADEELAKRAGASALMVRTPYLRDAAEALLKAREGTLPVPAFRPGVELEEQHRLRVLSQLEKQLAMNAAYAYRSSMHASMLSVMAGISEVLSQTKNLEDYLPEILTNLLDAAGVSKGAIFLREADESIGLRIHAGLSSHASAAMADLFRAPSIFQDADQERAPVVIPSRSIPADKAQRVLSSVEAESLLVVPVPHGNDCLGFLVLASTSRNLTEPDWIPFGRTMGIQVGQALAVGRAFLKLASSERWHRALLENANDAIAVLDTEGRIREVNQKAEELVAWPRGSLVGRPWQEFIFPEDRERAEEHLRELVGGGATKIESIRFVRSDGKPVAIEMSASVVTPGPDGAVLVIGRDITERQEAERRIREGENHLRQAQKMEVVGQLAGGVAHDFNNLLTAILGFTEMAMAPLAKGDPMRSDLEEVFKAGQRAAALTRQLLAFGRRQILQPRNLDINERVTDLVKMLRRIIGEDVELITKLAPGVDRICADPGQIEQVILNLAVNARDAMPDGGKLVVQTSNVDLDAAGVIDKARQAPGKYVRLDVIDTGTGMSDEVKSHLFEPFFTTKEVGKGTGLGLATVHDIVKQSGGHIEVESRPGRGTTFRIFFPRVMEADAQRPASVIMTRKGGGETVLLVEDEETVRAMIGAALRKEGYKLLVAQHGEEALDIVERHKGSIHLAITDMVMPKMNGREFAERLQKVRPETKILYMSGYTDSGLSQRVLPSNMPFLQKPFTREGLIRKLHDLLESKA